MNAAGNLRVLRKAGVPSTAELLLSSLVGEPVRKRRRVAVGCLSVPLTDAGESVFTSTFWPPYQRGVYWTSGCMYSTRACESGNVVWQIVGCLDRHTSDALPVFINSCHSR